MIGFLGVIFSLMALIYIKRNRKADLILPLAKEENIDDKSLEISKTINK